MKLLLATINPNVSGGTEDLSLQLKGDAPLQKGVALSAMQRYLTADGGAGGYTYSATGLPAWATLNAATGEITGTPDAYAHTVFTATVTDSASASLPVTFTIDVPIPLYGIDVTPPDCEADFTYAYQLSIGGATGAVTYALASGSLAGNLSVNSSGLISGLPSLFSGGGGLHSCVITASDAGTGAVLNIPISFSCGFYDTLGAPPNYLITVGVEMTLPNGQVGGAKPITYKQNFFSSTTNGAIEVAL